MNFPIHIYEQDKSIVCADPAEFEAYLKECTLICAAGGIVLNNRDEILMIHRLGRWDFPKGKIEAGESSELAAMREVEEETGLKAIEVKRDLPSTFHVYELSGKKILKQTFWFEMRYSGGKLPVPQTEEDITEVQWVAGDRVGGLLKDSYPSLQDFWRNMGTLE